MVKISNSLDVITRPANVLAYGAFSYISDTTSRTITIPVPQNVGISIRRVAVTLNWSVSTTPNVFRLWFFESEPTPPTLAIADRSFTLDYTPYPHLLSRFLQITGNDMGGITYASSTISPGLEMNSITGTIHAALMTVTGTNSISGGKAIVKLYYERT